jgi:hypothetical protein
MCVGNLQDRVLHVKIEDSMHDVRLIRVETLATSVDFEENREVDKKDMAVGGLKMRRQ